MFCFFFFFNDTATTEIYTLSLHDALPICRENIPRLSPREARPTSTLTGSLRPNVGSPRQVVQARSSPPSRPAGAPPPRRRGSRSSTSRASPPERAPPP